MTGSFRAPHQDQTGLYRLLWPVEDSSRAISREVGIAGRHLYPLSSVSPKPVSSWLALASMKFLTAPGA